MTTNELYKEGYNPKLPMELCPRCRRVWIRVETCYCTACEEDVNLKVFGLLGGKTLVIQTKGVL
jgi:hypothetical protein